ncbi:MAG: hypothetical protein ABW123_08695 [Cystobacter sp.]
MSDPTIRTEILKRYHEASYGEQEAGPEAFLGATFEEYYLLRRIQYPQISRRRAAEMSDLLEFRKLADRLPAEGTKVEEPSKSPSRSVLLRQKAELDLSSVKLTQDVTVLALDRVKSITGWEALRQAGRLEALSLTVCGTPPQEPLNPPVAVKNLYLLGCSKNCVELVFQSTRAQQIRLLYEEPSALSLELLKGHERLEELDVDSGMTRGLKYLEPLPLKVLGLSGIVPDAALKRLLEARARALEELTLTSHEPFGPSLLPRFPSLRRLSVPAFDGFREEWVKWAVDHPQVACRFPKLDAPAKRPVMQLAEVYRGVDILRIRKGKQTAFEVASNLVEDVLDTDDMDNGELEDKMRALAKKNKRQAEWSSEGDTFVMRAKDLETCRWLIDSVHALAARGV